MDLCVQIVFKELKTIQKPLEIFSIFTLLWYCFTKITPTFWAPPRYHRHIHIPFSFPFGSELTALNHVYDHNKDLPPGPVQQNGAPKTGYWRNVMRKNKKRIGNTINHHDAYLFIAAFKILNLNSI